MSMLAAARVAPVEYAVAVDRYLDEAQLTDGSRRVYRISLAGWAWPLVGKARPDGVSRRRAVPPVVPLAVLDDEDAGRRLAAAVASRLSQAEVRTVHRELSALRGAIGWWRRREWIAGDPTAALAGPGERPLAALALTEAEADALFRLPASLREQALWHLLRDSGVTAGTALKLDAGALDLAQGACQDRERCSGPVERPYQRPAWLAASGPTARAGVPHRPPRSGRNPRGGHLRPQRPRANVIPAGG